jgi:hypothetical protein
LGSSGRRTSTVGLRTMRSSAGLSSP